MSARRACLVWSVFIGSDGPLLRGQSAFSEIDEGGPLERRCGLRGLLLPDDVCGIYLSARRIDVSAQYNPALAQALDSIKATSAWKDMGISFFLALASIGICN